MKIAILYGSTKNLSVLHRPVHIMNETPYYVRMEIIDKEQYEKDEKRIQGIGPGCYLSMTNPMPGETVLNTVELP